MRTPETASRASTYTMLAGKTSACNMPMACTLRNTPAICENTVANRGEHTLLFQFLLFHSKNLQIILESFHVGVFRSCSYSPAIYCSNLSPLLCNFCNVARISSTAVRDAMLCGESNRLCGGNQPVDHAVGTMVIKHPKVSHVRFCSLSALSSFEYRCADLRCIQRAANQSGIS